MADNKKPEKEPIYEFKETLYEKAVKKMNADRIIVQFDFKIENYEKAASMFEELGEYLDAPELAEKCHSLAEKTAQEKKKFFYQDGSRRMETARTEKDYEKLEACFAGLGDYENAQQLTEICRQKQKQLNKKSRRTRGIVLGCLTAVVVLAAAGAATGYFRYIKGICYSKMGYYEKAETAFETLGDFLDSRARIQECRNVMKKDREKSEAKKLWSAHAGDKVTYGSCEWKVLRRDGDSLYLVMSKTNEDSDFVHRAYHDAQETVSWETCSLREWLNTVAIKENFSEEECSYIISGKFDGIALSEDRISILTAEEVAEYQDILDTLRGMDYWIRGKDGDRAEFVTGGGNVMTDGYPVSSAQISVRPVIWVDCSWAAKEDEA